MALASSSRRQYRKWGQRFAAFQAGGPPGQPLEVQVRAFLATLTPASARLGRSALKWHFPDVPWHQIQRSRYRRAVGTLARTILSPEEVRRLRAWPMTPRERAALECLWTLRRAEVAALGWDAMELARGVVYVRGKGDKDAATVLMPEAVAALRIWFEAAGRPPGPAPVFPGPTGRPISPQRLEQWVREIFRRAELLRPRRACHAFRRTFASRYLEANPEDLVGLKALLRHERLDTTLDYVFLRASVLAPRLARVRL